MNCDFNCGRLESQRKSKRNSGAFLIVLNFFFYLDSFCGWWVWVCDGTLYPPPACVVVGCFSVLQFLILLFGPETNTVLLTVGEQTGSNISTTGAFICKASQRYALENSNVTSNINDNKYLYTNSRLRRRNQAQSPASCGAKRIRHLLGITNSIGYNPRRPFPRLQTVSFSFFYAA